MLREADIKINRLKSDCVPVVVILMSLGHNWLENQTWYLTGKIQDSSETKKKKSNEFCQEMLSILENIACKLESVGQFFSIPSC